MSKTLQLCQRIFLAGFPFAQICFASAFRLSCGSVKQFRVSCLRQPFAQSGNVHVFSGLTVDHSGSLWHFSPGVFYFLFSIGSVCFSVLLLLLHAELLLLDALVDVASVSPKNIVLFLVNVNPQRCLAALSDLGFDAFRFR